MTAPSDGISVRIRSGVLATVKVGSFGRSSPYLRFRGSVMRNEDRCVAVRSRMAIFRYRSSRSGVPPQPRELLPDLPPFRFRREVVFSVDKPPRLCYYMLCADGETRISACAERDGQRLRAVLRKRKGRAYRPRSREEEMPLRWRPLSRTKVKIRVEPCNFCTPGLCPGVFYFL